ncbi:MAG: ABC transporter permease, partial [Oscillospiraceae bacterium]|nr:ABC transporter permease [Oscillospiraceae bacterium]
MNSLFYPKLALTNIRKNARMYLPYLFTCIFTVAMYYIMKSLSLNTGLNEMIGADTLIYILKLGCHVIEIFAFIFLFYTNSFLMKNRKKEFGLFNILGMEKKHIAKVIGFESLYVAVISLSAGFGAG